MLSSYIYPRLIICHWTAIFTLTLQLFLTPTSIIKRNNMEVGSLKTPLLKHTAWLVRAFFCTWHRIPSHKISELVMKISGAKDNEYESEEYVTVFSGANEEKLISSFSQKIFCRLQLHLAKH